MKIAFIGLGNMGGPMAMNLHKAGHQVSGFDLSEAACKKYAADGLAIAATAAATLDGAEVVVSMLPASQHVEALYLGDKGLLAQIAPGTLVIDSSTIAAASSRGREKCRQSGEAHSSPTGRPAATSSGVFFHTSPRR